MLKKTLFCFLSGISLDTVIEKCTTPITKEAELEELAQNIAVFIPDNLGIPEQFYYVLFCTVFSLIVYCYDLFWNDNSAESKKNEVKNYFFPASVVFSILFYCLTLHTNNGFLILFFSTFFNFFYIFSQVFASFFFFFKIKENNFKQQDLFLSCSTICAFLYLVVTLIALFCGKYQFAFFFNFALPEYKNCQKKLGTDIKLLINGKTSNKTGLSQNLRLGSHSVLVNIFFIPFFIAAFWIIKFGVQTIRKN